MQQRDTSNRDDLTDLSEVPVRGRIIGIDPGTKRCGVAVCDELRVTTRPLDFIVRTNWKNLLSKIREIVSEYDARAAVIGLPLESDGSESEMSTVARRMARNLALSVTIPVYLQDERVTSYDAKARLWAEGKSLADARKLTDSTAAAIILADFLDRMRPRD